MFCKSLKIYIAVIISLLLVFSFSACKKDDEKDSFQTEESYYSFSPEASNCLDSLRRADGDNNSNESDGFDAKCAVAYLGTVDTTECYISSNQALYKEIIESNGYAERYPFLDEIPSFDIFESADGAELYCIVPPSLSTNVSVKIPEESLVPEYVYPEDSVQSAVDHGGTDENGMCLLYSRNNSDPVLLCINSEMCPSEVLVTVTLSDGDIISFSPKLRQTDSRLDIQDGMRDFSLYEPYATDAEFVGNWICSYVEDDLENKRSIFMYLNPVEDGCTVNCGYSAIEGINAEMNLFSYSGTWSVAQYSTENYEEGCVILDLQSDGGVYHDAGAPIHSVSSVLAITEVPGNSDSIAIRCVDGEPIVPGTLYKNLIFNRMK